MYNGAFLRKVQKIELSYRKIFGKLFQKSSKIVLFFGSFDFNFNFFCNLHLHIFLSESSFVIYLQVLLERNSNLTTKRTSRTSRWSATRNIKFRFNISNHRNFFSESSNIIILGEVLQSKFNIILSYLILLFFRFRFP